MWTRPYRPDWQMTKMLYTHRPRRFQWTWSAVNQPCVCWVIVSEKFKLVGWMDGRRNGWTNGPTNWNNSLSLSLNLITRQLSSCLLLMRRWYLRSVKLATTNIDVIIYVTNDIDHKSYQQYQFTVPMLPMVYASYRIITYFTIVFKFSEMKYIAHGSCY